MPFSRASKYIPIKSPFASNNIFLLKLPKLEWPHQHMHRTSQGRAALHVSMECFKNDWISFLVILVWPEPLRHHRRSGIRMVNDQRVEQHALAHRALCRSFCIDLVHGMFWIHSTGPSFDSAPCSWPPASDTIEFLQIIRLCDRIPTGLVHAIWDKIDSFDTATYLDSPAALSWVLAPEKSDNSLWWF